MNHTSSPQPPADHLQRFVASVLSTYGYVYAKGEHYETATRLLGISKQILGTLPSDTPHPPPNVAALWERSGRETAEELSASIDDVLDQIATASRRH